MPRKKIDRRVKVLCVCRWGNIRSVALARLLKHEGYDALACGVNAHSPQTFAMLSGWADFIFVAKREFSLAIPEAYKTKVIDARIGEDIWLDADHPDLMAVVKRVYKDNKTRLWSKLHE